MKRIRAAAGGSFFVCGIVLATAAVFAASNAEAGETYGKGKVYERLWEKAKSRVEKEMWEEIQARCEVGKKRYRLYLRGVADSVWVVVKQKITPRSRTIDNRVLPTNESGVYDRCDARAAGDEEASYPIEIETSTTDSRETEVIHGTEDEWTLGVALGKEDIAEVEGGYSRFVNTRTGKTTKHSATNTIVDDIDLKAEAGTMVDARFFVQKEKAVYDYDAVLRLDGGVLELGVKFNRIIPPFYSMCASLIVREATVLKRFPVTRILPGEEREIRFKSIVKVANDRDVRAIYLERECRK